MHDAYKEEPQCKVDTACYETCTARLATQANCEPTAVNADVTVMRTSSGGRDAQRAPEVRYP